MSIQFGQWNLKNEPVDQVYLEKVKSSVSPYGPDGGRDYGTENASILYYAFHTTPESKRETQPYVLPSGAVMTWDGRLDNCGELAHELADVLPVGPTDLQVVAAAYERWGTVALAKLLGDWALAIWNGKSQFLILAKDFLGARQLYYTVEKDRVTWSTVLDPLVLCGSRHLRLNEEYMAGWMAFHPASHLSPYAGIHSVPPASFVVFRPTEHTTKRYWDFDPVKRISYRTDAEYEEHFRTVFRDSVRRRLRSTTPIVAELSGGMDSSSIVCMADDIIDGRLAEAPAMHTVSYYDDSEPNWDERPYFRQVEEKRGCVGCHINVAGREIFKFKSDKSNLETTPASTAARLMHLPQRASFIRSLNSRVVLSGVGGDEVMGGVPTPIPELQDLLAQFQLRQLVRQLKVWALNQRVPWVFLFLETVRDFLPSSLVGLSEFRRPAPWISVEFLRRNKEALWGYPSRLRLWKSLPSFQANISALEQLQRQVSCSSISADPTCEMRYPYLDRSLLEFIYSIPREQLVRPGQRRSLMRRALLGLVPAGVLNRNRKGFVARGPRLAFVAEWATLAELIQNMKSGSIGYVDQDRLLDAVQKARNNEEVSIVRLIRVICSEIWLRTLSANGLSIDTDQGTFEHA